MAAETTPQSTTKAHTPSLGNVTPRSIILGLLISVVTIAIIIWAEYVQGTIQIGFLQIPPVAVALIFLVVLLNRLAGWLWPRSKLTPAELVVIYVMMVFSSMVTSRGVTERIYAAMTGLNYYATPANHWQKLYWPNVKPWLVPWNLDGGISQPMVKHFYEGLPAGSSIPWIPWILPSAVWLLLFGLVYMAFMGLASIVYKLWADEEHLAFPLTKLPLELVNSGTGGAQDFLRNKLMWVGFAVPALVFGLNGMHAIWANVPQIKTMYSLSFTSFPWSAASGWDYLVLSFAGVGFFYLLSSEMVFSLWFFFVLGRLQEVLGAAIVGNSTGAFHACGPQFISDQNAGMYFALVGLMVYNAWSRLRDTWRRQAEGDKEASNTLISFRTSAILIIAAMVGILIWWMVNGGSAPMALFEFGLYLFFQAIIMARATAEAGVPMTEGSFTPFDVFRAFSPAVKVSPTDLTLLAFNSGMFVRDLRGMTLTGMFDAQNLADGVQMQRKKMVGVIVLAILFAMVVSAIGVISLTYVRGGTSMYSYVYGQWGNPTAGFNQHAALLDGIEQTNPLRPIWIAAGALFCLFLGGMRRMYVWWPFHPLGAALSITWIMVIFWFPAFIAWITKTVITRYGGVRTYQKLRPLFLGFIFGEFFTAMVWTLISFIFKTPAPSFPWS